MHRGLGIVILSAIAVAGSPGRGAAAMLDPTAFASLGTLNLTSGTYSFIVGSSGSPTLAQYNGIQFTTLFTGEVRDGINVFTFDSVSIGSGVILAASNSGGAGPVALLSKTTESIAGTINVSGGTGRTGPGGGFFGNGANRPVGGGGAPGGTFVGDLATELRGGGNGGTGFTNNGNPGAPGGGGGGIELGAVQSIVLTSTGVLNASGGAAFSGGGASGGGAGGGILLHAGTVTLSGLLDARGGAGSAFVGGQGGSSAGGAGGVGQILVGAVPGGLIESGDSHPGVTINFVPLAAPVPEPSSLVLLIGTSTLGLLGASFVGRRRAIA